MAAELADGIITSVKVPADTIENVIDPAAEAAQAAGRAAPKILATRWSIHASNEDDARITSYNVCYTKLLRTPPAAARPPRARESRESRPSYNFV